jgi:hypothetical protein
MEASCPVRRPPVVGFLEVLTKVLEGTPLGVNRILRGAGRKLDSLRWSRPR